MAISLSTLPQQIKLAVKGLSPGKLVAMAILIGGIIAGIGFLLSWSQTDTFQTLYTGLSAEDAAQVVARLKDRKIPYQLGPDGASIRVPQDRIHETRLDMASVGLPKSNGIGFEVFDETRLGMTEFVQNVNYQRALQGELSRTINSLSEVEHSRVHIVMPTRSLFIEEDEPATASVTVKLRPGRALNKEQIQGIVHLVSSSVSRLSPDDVTIIDNTGKMLAGFKVPPGLGNEATTQLAFQEKKERALENRIRTLLESVLGKDKAIVRVSCDLELVHQEKTEELFLPDHTVMRSEQGSSSVGGAAAGASGVPGVQANVAPGNPRNADDAAGAGTSQRQQFTKNYEVGKTISRQIIPAGNIRRLSVAVVVDGTYQPPEEGAEDEAPQYMPRTPEEMTQLENIVKSAVNYNEARGDKIEVVNIPLQMAAAEEEQLPSSASAGWRDVLRDYSSLLKYLIVALFLVFSYSVVLKPLSRWLTSMSMEEIRMLEQLPQTLREMERRYAEEGRENSYTREVENLIRSNQAGSAQIMKSWVKET